MEISELQDLWTKCDAQLTASIKINKRILREMLLRRPLKTMKWLQVKALFQIVISAVVLIFFVKEVRLQVADVRFFSGFILLVSLYCLAFFRLIKYFLLLQSVNMSGDLIAVKRQLTHIQKYKLMNTKYNFFSVPPTLIAVALVFPISYEIMIPVLVSILIGVIVAIYKSRLIARQFARLDGQLKELEDLY